MPKERCFVIMPFSETSEKHTQTYWTEFFANFLKPTIESLGFVCERSRAGPGSIIQGIIGELASADLVLAILTDFNSNVWYELGVRHTLKRGTIMAIENGQRAPIDISHHGIIHYTDSAAGASEFRNEVMHYLTILRTTDHPDGPPGAFQQLTVRPAQVTNEPLSVSPPAASSATQVLWLCPVDVRNKATTIMEHFGNAVQFDFASDVQSARSVLTSNHRLILSTVSGGGLDDWGVSLLRGLINDGLSLPPVVFYDGAGFLRPAHAFKPEPPVRIAGVTSSPAELVRVIKLLAVAHTPSSRGKG